MPGVIGVAPFSINPMMLTHGDATATGVLLKGVDPKDSLGVGADPGVPPVLDLPRHIVEGEFGTCPAEGDLACGIHQLSTLRRNDAKPAERRDDFDDPFTMPSHSDTRGQSDAGPGDDWQPDADTPLLREVQREVHHAGADKEDEDLPVPSASASAAPVAPRPAAPNDGPTKPIALHRDDKGEVAGDPPKSNDKKKASAPADAADAGPSGNVVPDGGYKSVLPSDDDLPPELTTDACADPERVKSMPGIIVGVSLAKTLKLSIGDCVTVTSPTIGYQVSGGSLRPPVAKSFRVMAMFEAGFDQYDSKLVYTDLYEAQSFSDQGDTVTGVEMKVDDVDNTDKIIDGVPKDAPPALKKRLGIRDVLENPSGYHIMDWKELNHGLFTALLIQKVGMSSVLALIILVAAFTVVATLIMVVLDKKKEIAVLKAMGATDWAVLRIFLYQGGIIGAAGTTLGLGVGLAVCESLIKWAFPLDPKVYFISHLPVLVRPIEFVYTGLIAVVLCLFATLVPSYYAANLRPADGFREQ